MWNTGASEGEGVQIWGLVVYDSREVLLSWFHIISVVLLEVSYHLCGTSGSFISSLQHSLL